MLEKYDKNKLNKVKGKKSKFVLEYEACVDIISELKSDKDTSFLPGPLADSLGVSTETVKSHAEKVGVETPGVGKKNFRYPEKDMVLILNSMKMGSDRRLRKKAIERLESLDSPGLKSDGNTI